jgi:hypothetical protein
MQHPDKILATYVWNICNIQIKHTCNVYLKNRWNIRNKRLQHTCIAIATYATSQYTFTTSVWNTWNIYQKYLKHLKHKLATCLKTPETLETQHRRRSRPIWWGTAMAQASTSCRRRKVDGGIGARAGLSCLHFCDGRGGWWRGTGARSSAGRGRMRRHCAGEGHSGRPLQRRRRVELFFLGGVKQLRAEWDEWHPGGWTPASELCHKKI